MANALPPAPWLPDPHASRAVLVGVSRYGQLEQLPSVERNLQALERVLTSPEHWGLRPEDCRVLHNPPAADFVLDAIHQAAAQATEGLIVYFAGHGLLDDRYDLHLALPRSSRKQLYKAVRYDDLRREVVDTARRCQSKVVILDCCYSGRALQGGMSGSDVAEQARIQGTYLMTATAETSVALAPPGAEFTAFTGALIDKIENGIADGPELLDLETIFYHLRADLTERRLPRPQQRSRNDGTSVALVRNTAIRGPAVAIVGEVASSPSLPPEVDETVHLPPAAMTAHLVALRESGDGPAADALLAAAAVHRRNQELAALAILLDRDGLQEDFGKLVDFAMRRSVDELMTLIRTLDLIDAQDIARRFVERVAAGPPSKAAQLTKLLRDDGRPEHLEHLVDAAIHEASDIGSKTALLGELWVAGLRGEVDQLVQRVATGLPAGDVLALADELRTAGREEASFRLYAMATEPLSDRPPRTIAQLTESMTAAGRIEESKQVAHDAAFARTDPSSMMELANEYIATGQEGYARQALDRGAQILGDADIADLARSLRASNHEDAAFQLLVSAVVSRPATSAVALVDGLRQDGRPVDAMNLLRTATPRFSSDQEVANLLALTTAHGRKQDFAIVLAAASERSADGAAGLLEAVAKAGVDLSPAEFATLVNHPSDEDLKRLLAELDPVLGAPAIAAIYRYVAAEKKAPELGEFIATTPIADARKLFYYVALAGNPTLTIVMRRLFMDFHYHFFPELLRVDPVTQLGALVASLRNAGFGGHADAALVDAQSKNSTPEILAVAIRQLRRSGQDEDADKLLSEVVDKKKFNDFPYGSSVLQLLEFIFALNAGGQHEDIHRTIDRLPLSRSRDEISTLAGMLSEVDLPGYAKQVLARLEDVVEERPAKTGRWRRT